MMLVKTKDAQPMGEYKPTELDSKKKACDFLLTGVGSKNRIVWADGKAEYVTDRRLQNLQNQFTWATDF